MNRPGLMAIHLSDRIRAGSRSRKQSDDAIARGSEFVFASSPVLAQNIGSYFLRELGYLDTKEVVNIDNSEAGSSRPEASSRRAITAFPGSLAPIGFTNDNDVDPRIAP